jgi:hypothetical protein
VTLCGTRYVRLDWFVIGLRDSEYSVAHDWPSIIVRKIEDAPSSELVIGVEMVCLDQITWSVGVTE